MPGRRRTPAAKKAAAPRPAATPAQKAAALRADKIARQRAARLCADCGALTTGGDACYLHPDASYDKASS